MEYKIRSSLCRLCLCCNDSVSSIFENNGSDQYEVTSLLRELLQFEVSEDDGYPNKICLVCLKTITDFKKFKVNCLEAMITYDAEIGILKKEGRHQQLQAEEVRNTEFPNVVIKHESISDHLDAFGNLLTKEEGFLSEGERLSCIAGVDYVESKEEPGDSQAEENDETTSENIFAEEIPIEIVDHPVKREHFDCESTTSETHDSYMAHPAPSNSDELHSMSEESFLSGIKDFEASHSPENTLHYNCSVLRTKHVLIEDEPGCSTSIILENFHEKEDSITMSEFNADNNIKGHIGKDEKQEQKTIKKCNDAYKMVSPRNSPRKKSYKSVSIDTLAKEKENLKPKRKCFICDVCGKLSFDKRIIAYHVRIHSGARPHKCKVCNKSFSQPSNLKRHEIIHSGIKSFECKFCHKTFGEHSDMVVHEKRHLGERNYPCDHCLKRCVLKHDLVRHQVCHKQERRFFCGECGRGFTVKADLKIHQIFHKHERPFLCRECGKGFKTKSCLTRHMIVHSGFKPFTCHVCNSTFSQNANLKMHSIIHMEVKPFTCLLCKRYFRNSGELKNHKCIDNNEIIYSCCKCSSKFPGIKSLRTHETQCKKRQK